MVLAQVATAAVRRKGAMRDGRGQRTRRPPASGAELLDNPYDSGHETSRASRGFLRRTGVRRAPGSSGNASYSEVVR
jgi:hypothetical protein